MNTSDSGGWAVENERPPTGSIGAEPRARGDAPTSNPRPGEEEPSGHDDPVATKLATGLGVVGIGRGDRVAVHGPSSADRERTIRAIRLAGAICVGADEPGYRLLFNAADEDVGGLRAGRPELEQVVFIGGVSWWTLVELGRSVTMDPLEP